MLKNFLDDETGAVTVDWVVLTAALVGLGLAVMVVVSNGAEDLSGDIQDTLERDDIIQVSFGRGAATNLLDAGFVDSTSIASNAELGAAYAAELDAGLLDSQAAVTGLESAIASADADTGIFSYDDGTGAADYNVSQADALRGSIQSDYEAVQRGAFIQDQGTKRGVTFSPDGGEDGAPTFN